MPTWLRCPGRAAALGAVLGGAVTVGAIVEARVGFRLRKCSLPVLPAGSAPIRVLHLSDFHLLASMKTKSRWVRSLAELAPDFIVNTGDNLSSAAAFDLALETLEPFLKLPGAFVFGSNDYFAPQWKNPLSYLLGPSQAHTAVADAISRKVAGTAVPVTTDADLSAVAPLLPAAEFAAALTAAGWHDLRNATASVSVAGTRLALIGVDDPHIAADSLPIADQSELDPAAALTIGLTHAPYSRVLDDFARLGVAVTFAGHTHGGQLSLPGYGALVTNCDLPSWRASGVQGWPGTLPGTQVKDPSWQARVPSQWVTPVIPWHTLRPVPANLPASQMWLAISAGLGTSPFAPIRLFTRPEASLITLTARVPD